MGKKVRWETNTVHAKGYVFVNASQTLALSLLVGQLEAGEKDLANYLLPSGSGFSKVVLCLAAAEG